MQKDNQENILVSVIIPIHNAGKWLTKCLDTLQQQTLRAMEFICVLDCPTDGSDQVVMSYAAKDDRFVVIRNQINLGIAGSRNLGISVARGEYIGFSDHDDWRTLDMYEKLYQETKVSNSDVVLSSTCLVHENFTEVVGFEPDVTPQSLLTSIVSPVISKYCKNKLARSVWHSIYRRTFIVQSGVMFFNRQEFFEEDSLFNFQVFSRTKSISQLNEAFYQWNWTRVENQNNYSKSTSLQSYANYLNEIKKNLGLTDAFSNKEKKRLLSRSLSIQFYHKFNRFKLLKLSEICSILNNDVFLLKFVPVLHENEKFTALQQLKRNYFLLLKFYVFIFRLQLMAIQKMIR